MKNAPTPSLSSGSSPVAKPNDIFANSRLADQDRQKEAVRRVNADNENMVTRMEENNRQILSFKEDFASRLADFRAHRAVVLRSGQPRTPEQEQILKIQRGIDEPSPLNPFPRPR